MFRLLPTGDETKRYRNASREHPRPSSTVHTTLRGPTSARVVHLQVSREFGRITIVLMKYRTTNIEDERLLADLLESIGDAHLSLRPREQLRCAREDEAADRSRHASKGTGEISISPLV